MILDLKRFDSPVRKKFKWLKSFYQKKVLSKLNLAKLLLCLSSSLILDIDSIDIS